MSVLEKIFDNKTKTPRHSVFIPAHTIDDVRALSTIRIDNNFSGTIQAINKAGYSTAGMETRSGLGKILLDIYGKDKKQFVSIVNSIPWNDNANNYTTSIDFYSSISKLIGGLKSEGKIKA